MGVFVNGNNNHVAGGTHSNGLLDIGGENNALGPTTYGGPNGCPVTEIANGNTFGGSTTPTADANPETWPANFAQTGPACTQNGSSFSWSGNNIVIPSGVYCATSSITLNGNGFSCVGGCTFEAPSFTIGGNSWAMTGYGGTSLLLDYTGTGTLTLTGNNFNGQSVFAPAGTVDIVANNAIFSGFVEAQNVEISGNNNVFTGVGPPLPGGGGTLVQ
jgi:hypothetical protein